MSDQQNNLATGFFANELSPKTPDWVKANIGIKVSDAIKFLQENQDEKGYVRIKVLTSQQTGKPYCAIDRWKPGNSEAP